MAWWGWSQGFLESLLEKEDEVNEQPMEGGVDSVEELHIMWAELTEMKTEMAGYMMYT